MYKLISLNPLVSLKRVDLISRLLKIRAQNEELCVIVAIVTAFAWKPMKNKL